MVTTEVAVILPVLVMVALVCLWFVDTVRVQALAQDAARATAREIVRGVPVSQARRQGRQLMPSATISATVSESFVRVDVTQDRSWAGFGGLWPHRVAATAVGQLEKPESDVR
jgi:Flp pilus assembly protein TadG